MYKKRIGYIYSSREIEKNTEIFFRLCENKQIEIISLNLAFEINEEEFKKLFSCDVIYNDSGEENIIELIKIFEKNNIPVIDSSKAREQENKWNFYKICIENNIPTPKTILLDLDTNIAKEQLLKFNEWPVILKRVEGTWGEFVVKAENLDDALEKINYLWQKGNKKIPIIAQEFINSFSYRVTYIGDEIVQTAIKENNNWKCTGVYAKNFKKFEVDEKLKEIVEKIMKNTDLKICGVDLLKKGEQWLVIEINTEPALDFFEEEREILIEKIINLLISIADKKIKENLIIKEISSK